MRLYHYAIIAVCFGCGSIAGAPANDATKRLVGAWTDDDGIRSLELSADGRLRLDCHDEDGSWKKIEGRWSVVGTSRMKFVFDTFPPGRNKAVPVSLFMKFRFDRAYLIHIPEQGRSKGKEIKLRRKKDSEPNPAMLTGSAGVMAAACAPGTPLSTRRSSSR